VAVEPKRPALVKEYWPRFHTRAVTLTILTQIAGTLAIGLALITAGVPLLAESFWIVIIAIIAASIGFNLLLVNQLLLPFRNLTNALTHISGEPTTVTPPNPNAKHFEKDGLKALLQLIYSLASNQPGTSKGATASAKIEPGRLNAALHNTAVGFAILKTSGEILYSNPHAPISSEQGGKSELSLIFDDEPSLQDWLRTCEEHAVHAEMTWLRIPNKTIGEEDRKIYDIVASYEKGSEAEVVLTFFDRTNDYQPEDDDLDFIAFAAHELRGPITVIRGYLDVLSDELSLKLEDDQEVLFGRLIVSANRLSSYVNNILNASRYDRRHLKMHLREDSLTAIYEGIRDDMELRASSQNRLLSVQFPADLPTIAADRASISEVISNLIDNAIKYSNEGGVVAVTARTQDNVVVISVEDHGIGMPGSVVSNLFHKFYRSHRSRETVAGTGIGLYICKAIVESHGGTIEVRSVEGQGSTFEFSLPIYSTVAEKLRAGGGSNESLIQHDETGWIKNHAKYRG
jgi:signal transduction histidine kinase